MTSARALAFSTCVAAVTLAAVAPAPAHADGKAWTAIKNTLPAQMYVIAGANFTTIRKSTIYKTYLPKLVNSDGDIKDGIATFKSVCKLDALTVIDDAVVAMSDEHKGVIVVALKSGVTEAKLTACLQKAAKKKDKLTITAQKTGNVVEYTATGEDEKLYVAWLAKDVVAIATNPTDRSTLDTFLTGSGAGGDMATALANVDTGAAVWGAMAKSQPMDKVGTMKALYGHADVAKGKLTGEVHVVLASAAEAKKAVAAALKQRDDMMTNLPPKLQALLGAISVTQAGAEAVVTSSLTEKDALGLIDLVLK